MGVKVLRAHQNETIDNIRLALAQRNKRLVVQAPTGFGKTLLASEIISRAVAKGRRVIFTAPALELIDQCSRAFFEHGITDIGVIQADHPMTDATKRVQVASIQTLARRVIPPADLVFIDECHRQSKFMVEWMGREDWAHVPFIGLSATPWATGMGRLWDRLIVASTTRQMIADGWLSPFRVFAPSHPDLTGIATVAGDYHEGQLSNRMREGQLTADICATWRAKAENRPTLLFAVDRAHARHLTDEFQSHGIEVAYIDGETPKLEREQIRKRFHNGSVKVVCNVGVLTTGVDWDVRCISYCRPTKSEILFVQIIGRGLRLAEGKQDLLILDHSDTTLRLGFVTDIHHERLSMGRLEDSAVQELPPKKPRECSRCHALMPSGSRVCSACGHEIGVRKEGVDTAPGELVEMGEYQATKAAKKRNKVEPMAAKAQFYAELQCYARQKGFSQGWAAHRYRDYYGVWPRGEATYAYADQVSMTTRSWLQSQNIRQAKSKVKQQERSDAGAH